MVADPKTKAPLQLDQRKPVRRRDRPSSDERWLERFERAFQAIAAEPDATGVIARLRSEVGRLLEHSATVEFLPVGVAPDGPLGDGTVVPVYTPRGQIGTLRIRGTVSHDELRAIRLLTSLAGQIGSRSLHDQRLQAAHRHERNAVAIYQAARDLVSIPDVDVVLDAIVRRAQDFTGADVAYLAMQVPDSEIYEHRASSGTRTTGFDEVRVAGLKGLTELAARERQAIVSNDFFSDPRRNTALDRYLRAEALVSLICAPMHVGDEFIGALFVASREAGSLTDADADLLAALGAIAAGAIVNARLHAAERQRADELVRINQVVATQHAQLEKWVQTHQRLTRMLLDGQSLPRVTAMIAQLVSNPVAVVDRSGRLRTFSDPAGDDAVDDVAGTGLRAAAVAALSERPVHQERLRKVRLSGAADGVDATLAPVTTRSGLLGYLVVIERDVSLDDMTKMFVGQAANAVAIEFMQEQVAAEVETRLRGDLVGELISQNRFDADELRERAARLGYDLRGELRLVVVAADPPDPGEPRPDSDTSLAHAVADALTREGRPPLLVIRHRRAIALVTRPTSGDAASSRLGCEELRGRIADRLGREVSLVAGTWLSDPGDLAAAYASIVKCLDGFTSWGRRKFVVDFEASAFDRMLVEVAGTRDAAAFVDDVLGKVIDYDRRRRGVLIESLEQYLLADSILEAAARTLNIHPHTLRYRLDKVADLTGRSTSDPQSKLEMLFALRLYRSLGASGQASTRPTAG